MQTGFIQKNDIKKETPLVDVKFTHSLCIGQTGSGKTTSFIYPNLLKRIELGHGILFFDIKGSEHTAVKKLANDANRLDDVIEIGKPWGENINIIKNFNNRTFASLLNTLIGDPKEAGSNAFFYTGAQSLGLNIFNILKILSIISQEIDELDGKISDSFKSKISEYKNFTLQEIYKITYSIDTLYNFIQDLKDLLQNLHTFLVKNVDCYTTDQSDLYKNITLNYANLNKRINSLSKYDVDKDDRADRSKFDPALTSVLHSLNVAFGFIATPAAKYISQKETPLDIVRALQKGKIIVVNVRVVPDVILELMLEQVFEKLIDLNVNNKDDRTPISIFIDEAQRLINKDIPLDVLRSSKIDVVMAVQSELQLISKFKQREHWQQISINIAKKIAFKSTMFNNSDDSLNAFWINTAVLNTFEYVSEHDKKIKLANPVFLDKKDLENIEIKYQHDILQLDDLKKNEIFKYDVTHFENEREVIIYNTDTKKKSYKKIFTPYQDSIIKSILEGYIAVPLDELIDATKKDLDGALLKKHWKKLYSLDINNYQKFKKAYYGTFLHWYDVYEVFLGLSYQPFMDLCEEHFDEIEFDDNEDIMYATKVFKIENKTIDNQLQRSIIENGDWIIFDHHDILFVFNINDEFKQNEDEDPLDFDF